MTILLLLIGLAAIALPGLRPATLLRSDPRVFTRLAAASVGAGLISILIGLLLSVSVGLFHLEFGHQDTSADHLAPEGAPGALVAAVVLVVLGARTILLASRSHRARRRTQPDEWLGHHQPAAEHQLTVLPTSDLVAFSIANRRGTTVVISEGLRDRTDTGTLQLIIRHELAHSRARDSRLLTLSRYLDVIGAIAPFAARTSAAIRVAAERAADEEAAGSDPTPRSQLAAYLAQSSSTLASCAPECDTYRAEQLIRPSSREPVIVASAFAGLLAVGCLAIAAVAHATSDLSPYLALLAG